VELSDDEFNREEDREDREECRRDFDLGGVNKEFRDRSGVRPVDDEGPGLENLTRFFDRCGVAGGVGSP
jgi:hypothetical protein